MGAINTYPDDTTTAADDKFLTLDNAGTTKLTAASTVKDYILPNDGVTPAKISTISKAGVQAVSANGAIVITGVGFQPGAIMFHGAAGGVASASNSANASNGYYDRSSNTQWTHGYASGAAAGGNYIGASYCVDVLSVNGGTSGTRLFRGSVTATGSDGFTVTIADYTSAGSFMWVAFR